MPQPLLGASLNALGWQCGSVIPTSCYEVFVPHLRLGNGPAPGAQDWLIVISQTCDVVAPLLDKEPFIEILWCRPIVKPRTQFIDLRSTRELDFRPDRNGKPDVVLTVHATRDRYMVPRDLFVNCAPDEKRATSAVALQRLQNWLALRYTRPAWPDSFVGRLSTVRESLHKALAPLSADVAEVRVALLPNDRELLDDEEYEITVFFVVPAPVLVGDEELQSLIYTAWGEFLAALHECKGIVIHNESRVISGAEFTWEDSQVTDLWNFANLTYALDTDR